MKRFFVDNGQVQGKTITITGSDVNHIKNVLRMKKDDKIIINTGQGREFCCIISEVNDSHVIADIITSEATDTELSVKFYLFQGIPKSDKMDLIIQKAVELGVYAIVPIITKRTIVKIDAKKSDKKIDRWNLISESAAKQSGRTVLPEINEVLTLKEAIEYSKQLDCNIIPYENTKSMRTAINIVNNIETYKSIGIFIGPEGGFDQSEISLAEKSGIIPISLGRRILRTETAGMAILSVMMFELEAKGRNGA